MASQASISNIQCKLQQYFTARVSLLTYTQAHRDRHTATHTNKLLHKVVVNSTHRCSIGQQVAEEGVGVVVEHAGVGHARHEAGSHLGQGCVVGVGEVCGFSLRTPGVVMDLYVVVG